MKVKIVAQSSHLEVLLISKWSEMGDFNFCGQWSSRMLPLMLWWSLPWFPSFYSDGHAVDKLNKETKITKVSFFVQFTKTQLITFQNFNIQTCFSQFLWFFSLIC